MTCTLDKVNYKNIVNKTIPPVTKCGEIHINDASTDAFLLCSFCTVEPGEDLKYLRTLKEFIAHIVWHRSDDIKEETTSNIEIIHVNYLDVPGDDLCAMGSEHAGDLGMNPMEMDSMYEQVTAGISEEVLVQIFDLYKKCPCLWHEQNAAKYQVYIEPAYDMLTKFYNKFTKESRPLTFVKKFLNNIKDSFLEEFVGKKAMIGDTSSMPPWYFMHLMFLLGSEDESLDETIYPDFECTICTKTHCTHGDLWEHFCDCHLASYEQNYCLVPAFSEENETSSASSELFERFIEAYKDQPCLWSRQHNDYRNRELRNKSLSNILKILQEHYPETTQNDVLAKIKYVRTRYSHERRKIREHKLLNVEYTPRIWYYKKLSFLANDEKGKSISQKVESKPVLDNRKTNSIKYYKCNVCAKTFTNSSPWLDHMQRGHEKEAFQSADGCFYCAICNSKCKTKNTFIRHLRQMHSDCNYKHCLDCGTKFRFISALAKHRANVHQDDRPFKCEACGKGFANLFRMNAHSITHWDASDRPYQCDYCGAKFSYRTNLNVHVRRHTKRRYVRCEICDHASATMTELRFHMLKHTKKYPYFCDICGKGFRSTARITKHKIECHGDAVFACEFCNKQFISEKKLRYHYESHQAVENLDCEACGRQFARKGSLRKHIRLKHRETLKVELCDNVIDENPSSEIKD